MLAHELEGLQRLGIRPIRWGTSYRVKVRGRTGKMVYVGNPSHPKNMRLIAAHYPKVSIERLQKHLSPDYQHNPGYHFQQEMYGEKHLYEHIHKGEFYEKLENVLLTQKKAYKINIALGYTLYDPVSDVDFYFYPNIANTAVFERPFTVNSRSDVRKIITEIRQKELSNTLKYPKSGVKLKEITAFQIIIDYRDHALGDSNALVPEFIKKNQYIINFPRTNNKCVFFCIAYHLQIEKNQRKVVAQVKDAFKHYCEYKGIKFSLGLYKNFKPIDILEFDQLEKCFNLNINVYSFNEETTTVALMRASESEYENTLNVLSHNGHAFYITNADRVQSNYICPKCNMIFDDCIRLRDHTKNKCDQINLESFPTKPTVYRPNENAIKRLLRKYKVKGVDHYLDHFIVFDFEAILEKIDEKRGDSTKFESRHKPVSVSICDSLTEAKECFVNEDPQALIKDMIDYIKFISGKISEYHRAKFAKIFDSIVIQQEQLLKRFPGILATGYLPNDREQAAKDVKEFGDINAKLNKDLEKLQQIIDQTPVLGFNSGSYDLNLIRNELFSAIGLDKLKHVIKSSGYMCISTLGFKMLDMINYLPAGVSYAKYIETYLGKCQCDDKIRCTCELTKGVFPCEYITSFNVLNETKLPPKKAFYSSLRNEHISDADYRRVSFAWEHYEMKTIKDLLIWYNNLDVVPFIKAIKKQRELFKRFDLDMFCDGVSLPGLSEKVMYQTLKLESQPKESAEAFDFPQKRFEGYIKQDQEAKREFAMTTQHLNKLLKKQNYLCGLCYCKLNEDIVSADRINNKLGHKDGNILITCIQCNVARKDMNIKAFKYKKLQEFNANRLVFSIDKEESEIYRKMKTNIVGGPSIIFNRYAKRNETRIRGDKLCKKIIGYDANALYLWCLGNEMPCGRLTTIEAYDGIVEDIKTDKIFGFLECDIETPEHLKGYFSEMTPIFKNVEIEPIAEVIGSHMFEYNESRDNKSKAKKGRKLIGSYFGNKILIYAPLLKWYLAHGMVITKTYSFIKAHSGTPFKSFMEQVSDARREGDVDDSKAMIAEMMKLVGNAAFGRSGMDMTKHKQVEYVSDEKKVYEAIEHFTYNSRTEFNDGTVEISKNKRRLKLSNPIHLSIAIYQLAKLRMLQFYYDCIDFYFDRSDFQYQEMDTDSGYIAFSCDKPFEQCIKPELIEHFNKHKYDWFPRDDTKENANFDKRTPGLFKEEYRCNAMVSLSSKNYNCYLPDEKYTKGPKYDGDRHVINGEVMYFKLSAKGVQKSKNIDVLSPANFEAVVNKDESLKEDRYIIKGVNKGFRVCKDTNSIITYTQKKTALNYYYDKRQVLGDGYSTIPLPI